MNFFYYHSVHTADLKATQNVLNLYFNSIVFVLVNIGAYKQRVLHVAQLACFLNSSKKSNIFNQIMVSCNKLERG